MIKNTKITGKLFVMLLPLIVTVLIGISYYSIRQIQIFNETKELYGEILNEVQSEIQSAELDFYKATNAETEIHYSSFLTSITKTKLVDEYKNSTESLTSRIDKIDGIVQKYPELYEGTEVEGVNGTFKSNLGVFRTLYKEWYSLFDPETGKGSFDAQQNRFGLTSIYMKNMRLIMESYSEKRMAELKTRIYQEITIVGILAVCIIGICLVISILVAKYIKKSIMLVMSSTEKLSNNDLSFELKDTKNKDEFGSMTRATAKLVSDFRHIIRTLSSSSNRLSESEQDLNDITVKATESVSQISRAISEMATTANMQAKDTECISQNILDLNAVMDESIASATSLNQASVIIESETSEGMDLVNELLKITEKNQTAFDEVFAILSDISNSTKEIGAASTLISDIASRTNLLSLNASIEAARAGEAGKGFAVVAEEIRDLAEQSKNSAETIDKLLAVLAFNSEKADAQSNVVKECVKTQTESVYTTMNKYKSIVDNISTINGQIEVLEHVNVKLENGFKDISELITSLSAASEENAAVADELAQQANNVLSNVHGIGSSSENVHNLADGLKDIVGMFKLDENAEVEDAGENTEENVETSETGGQETDVILEEQPIDENSEVEFEGEVLEKNESTVEEAQFDEGMIEQPVEAVAQEPDFNIDETTATRDFWDEV